MYRELIWGGGSTHTVNIPASHWGDSTRTVNILADPGGDSINTVNIPKDPWGIPPTQSMYQRIPGGSVYKQPEREVDDSCHNWRVPSK
jgi:hypothetical protein